MSIVNRVILELNGLLELFLMLLRALGPAFLARFLELLEKPWLVKR